VSSVAGSTGSSSAPVFLSSISSACCQPACSCRFQPRASSCACSGASGPATCTSSGQRWSSSNSLRRAGSVTQSCCHQACMSIACGAGRVGSKRSSFTGMLRGA